MAKVMISLSDELLREVDAAASRRGTTRSALLQASVRREIGMLEPDAFEARLRAARRRAARDGAPAGDPAAWVREDRDAR